VSNKKTAKQLAVFFIPTKAQRAFVGYADTNLFVSLRACEITTKLAVVIEHAWQPRLIWCLALPDEFLYTQRLGVAQRRRISEGGKEKLFFNQKL